MTEQFKTDVDLGLSAFPKHLSSKYFYDDIGSEIFRKIMEMPEYYLTDAEFEIMSLHGKQILRSLDFKSEFDVIELGAGDGVKTLQLLSNFKAVREDFTFVPIDISQKAIDVLEENVLKELPGLEVKSQQGDYFDVLEQFPPDTPNLILFLGSNIGNYQLEKAKSLLTHLYALMKEGDKLLIGFDLQKNPITVRQAYDDPHGITKAFNMNLLHRINKELDADFRLDKFDFYCHYNPLNGEVKSYLVSLTKQDVHIGALKKTFRFNHNELIWTELSKKFTIREVQELCESTGFDLKANFLDCKHYFVDSLWCK